MAWEKTSLDVARAVGLAVPVARLLRIGSDSVLLPSLPDSVDKLCISHVAAAGSIPDT